MINSFHEVDQNIRTFDQAFDQAFDRASNRTLDRMYRQRRLNRSTALDSLIAASMRSTECSIGFLIEFLCFCEGAVGNDTQQAPSASPQIPAAIFKALYFPQPNP